MIATINMIVNVNSDDEELKHVNVNSSLIEDGSIFGNIPVNIVVNVRAIVVMNNAKATPIFFFQNSNTAAIPVARESNGIKYKIEFSLKFSYKGVLFQVAK